MRARTLLGIGLISITVAACSDDKPASPTQPTPETPAAPTLTAPAAATPDDDQQLDTLRPTLSVTNATSNQTGAKTYEFQVSDSSDFAAASASAYAHVFKLVSARAGISEDASGRTSYEVPEDLQPTTRFYWRARVRQGTTDGPWSATRSFKTQIQGYNRPGELYDPLTNGSTVGNPIGSVTFIPGRGAQNNTTTSMIQYVLPQPITAGEFSAEVEGLSDRSAGDKTKVLTMYDGASEIHGNAYRMTVEKRGNGQVAWRFITGRPEDPGRQIDTDSSERRAVGLNPGATYLWKATWGGFFRVQIFQGGINGTPIYDLGKGVGGTYSPVPHLAQLGSPVPRSGPDSASVPGAIYRNVYIGSGARPGSLGSALLPKGQAQITSLRR